MVCCLWRCWQKDAEEEKGENRYLQTTYVVCGFKREQNLQIGLIYEYNILCISILLKKKQARNDAIQNTNPPNRRNKAAAVF